MEASSDWNKSNREAHISHGTSLTLERILAYNKAFNRNIQARIVNLNTPDGKVTCTVRYFFSPKIFKRDLVQWNFRLFSIFFVRCLGLGF